MEEVTRRIEQMLQMRDDTQKSGHLTVQERCYESVAGVATVHLIDIARTSRLGEGGSS